MSGELRAMSYPAEEPDWTGGVWVLAARRSSLIARCSKHYTGTAVFLAGLKNGIFTTVPQLSPVPLQS